MGRSRGEGRRWSAATEWARPWVIPVLVVGAVALALFLFYFPVYRVRGHDLPLGFDAPWYVWRAEFVAERGVGPMGTAVRPGHSILASVLAALTGRSQLELAVLLPLVLVAVFALAVGAFHATSVGSAAGEWAIAAAVAGTLIGATRLVGENVANLLLLALSVGALVAMGRWVSGRRGLVGAVVLLVSAGLAHWVFLAVVLAVLGTAAIVAIPASVRERRGGTSALRTESSMLGAVVVSVAALMGVVIAGALRAPFRTFEIQEDPGRFLPKLRTDLERLWLPVVGPAAAAGAVALARVGEGRGRALVAPSRVRAFGVRLMLAWTIVAVAGLLYGVVTLDLPPHRFLALLVALPVAAAAAEAVRVAVRWLLRRWGALAAAAGALVAVAALAVPGALAWYGQGPGLWIDPTALQQAETAARYLEGVPTEDPVVFVVGPFGRAGVLSVPLKERTIRVGLPPDRQEDVHLFVGDPRDALAGRRTVFEGPGANRAALPYWLDVRPVLASKPPLILLKALAGEGYDEAVIDLGAAEVAPGVAVMRGPMLVTVQATPAPAAVPTIESGAFLAGVLLVVLGLAGAGWTGAFVGRDIDRVVWIALSPVVGAGMLILAGLPVAIVGIGLGGPAGVAIYVVVVGAGLLAGGRGRA